MSSKIRVLSESTINKIAAGEVVENPSSVVKELVENALDAGATEICVEIKGGGRQLIRISDNGCGMSRDDAILCLERHATSKIREAEDIQSLLTMGFRGEAIPSIAAISKFTLMTCQQKRDDKDQTGTLIVVEGGEILSCSSAVRSPGTTVEVKSLFFNVPVRKKFQKSPASDSQEILKIMSLLALGYPSIQFELISDERVLLKTPPFGQQNLQEQLGQCVENILGQDFFNSTYPLSFSQKQYRLEGFIGFPSHTRPNRTGQYLFINQRAVQSSLISYAVREGYGTALATNRHPVFVLHLTMPTTLVDVNVHPQKKEVRLRYEIELKDYIAQAIQSVLKEQGFAEQTTSYVPFDEPLPSPQENPFPAEPLYKEHELSRPAWSYPAFTPSPEMMRTWSVAEEQTLTPSLPIDTPMIKKTAPCSLGTIPGFILIEAASLDNRHYPTYKGLEGLYLVDQRAAYARIHYERLLKQIDSDQSSRYVQPLLIPLTLEFSPLEAYVLKEYLVTFNQMGFHLQEFGETTFMVDAIPDFIKKEELKGCLMTILQELRDWQGTNYVQKEKEKRLAVAACRSSLPPSRRLSSEEANALLQQLFACDSPLQCPLGKSVIVYLSNQELSRFFIH